MRSASTEGKSYTLAEDHNSRQNALSDVYSTTGQSGLSFSLLKTGAQIFMT